MATAEVYNPTTAPNPRSACLTVPSENLDRTRFVIKVFEVLLSLVAFVLEEVVNSCVSCNALYFFEFVSCTAFLFTLLLVILLATPLHTRVGISCWPRLDFVFSAAVALFFLVASIVFTASNSNTAVEWSAVVFGYLASVLFLTDVVFWWRSHGSPFKKVGRADSRNGGLAAAAAPEKETLNTSTD